MNNVFVGKIVNTHGIKGEIRIKSDFERKSDVFKVGNTIIIRGISYKIMSYRVHKNFDMVTLEGLNDINQVIPFKGLNVFVTRESLNINENDYLLEDLIDMEVIIDSKSYGVIKDYTVGANPLLLWEFNDKTYYIPLKANYIKSVSKSEARVYLETHAKELII